MKKFAPFLLLLALSFSASAQYTFDWTAQPISEGNNLKAMDIVNDTMAILVGYGRTFVTSNDQGATWNDVGILDPEYAFEDISINSSGLGYATSASSKLVNNPSDGEPDVYADGLLLKTTDFGATWELVDITKLGAVLDPSLNPSLIDCYARYFQAVEVLDDGTVFVSILWRWYDPVRADNYLLSGVFKTTDGVIWTAISSGDSFTLGIEAATSNIYIGGNQHLYRAETGSDVLTDIYPNLVAAEGADGSVFVFDITIVSEDLIYIASPTDGIFVSEDKGDTFMKLGSGAPPLSQDMFVINDSVMMSLSTESNSMLTLDSAATWIDCYPGGWCHEIGGIMNDTLFALGESFIYKISVEDILDGSPFSWVKQQINDGFDLQKMHITDANNAIIAGAGQTFVSTSDGGTSWTDIALPELFVYGAEYDFEDVSTIDTVSFAISKRFYHVDYPSDSEYADLFAHGLIFKSTDLWKTWELLDYTKVGAGVDPTVDPNADGAFGLDPMNITVINDNIAFMGVRWLDSIAGYDTRVGHSNAFMTEDGGESWLPLFEDQGNRVFNKIQFIDKDNGFFLGNSFFRKTEDGGKTFTNMYSAIFETASPTDTVIFLKEIHYIDENNWYLLSSVDGVFVTSDGGVNYSKLTGIGGGGGMSMLDESSIIVLGSSTKSKLSWDAGSHWNACYPGSTSWGIGGILDDQLISLAKTSLYKIPMADLAPPEHEADILSFVLAEQTGDAVIDAETRTVTIEVAAGTDPSALTPTITISEGATIAPASEVVLDFSAPVTYTVTDEDVKIDAIWTVTVTIFVEVDETTVDNVMLYPNPASDKLFLDHLEAVESISIYSITGSSIYTFETPSNAAEIDLSEVEDGIYFITFTDLEGGVSTKKFIKN